MSESYQYGDFDSRSPAVAVAYAVAEADGVEPTELPPLGETIDPNAVNQCIEDESFSGQIQFEYAGYDVSVNSHGVIHLA